MATETKRIVAGEQGLVPPTPGRQIPNGQGGGERDEALLHSGAASGPWNSESDSRTDGSQKDRTSAIPSKAVGVKVTPEVGNNYDAGRIGDPIQDFIVTLNLGITWIYEAGKKLVRMLDRNPHIFEEILDRDTSGWLTADVLKTIEAIGRRQILPEVLMLPYHVASRLSTMPIEEQVKALRGVEVAVLPRNGKGGYHVRRKAIQDLSINEAARAFTKTGIRPPQEQASARRGISRTVSVEQLSLHGERMRVEIKTLPDSQKQRVRLIDGKALVEFYEITA